jgi:WNK lysine deficient protein kinase
MMTSKIDQEMSSHQTTSGNLVSVHPVEASTGSTVEEVSKEGSSKIGEMAAKADPVTIRTATTLETPKDDAPPLVVVTGFQAEAEIAADAAQEEGSVVSMPAAMSTSTDVAPEESSVVSMPAVIPAAMSASAEAADIGVVTVASAPTSDVAPEEGSVVSMPAAMPASAEANDSLRTLTDTDAATVASAPAVVVLVEADGGGYLDDFITSPHGNNAIVERSPGGRYVRFMEKLGSGASKDVYRAYDTQEGIEVAWNVVHLAGVPKNERNRIVNEVRLLERLHHHNIISFHGSWVNREKQQVNFITEILSSGTLKSFINKVQVIRWKIAKRWAVQILKGLEYLHSQEPPVIHRDLKCENIFINGTSGDLRIGDLGLSTVHRNGKVLSVLGTPEFMAPDMYEETFYDEKVDIYAFGMCLLEIFTKEIPYRECNNPAQIYRKVTRGDPPDSLKRLKSRHARQFIELCLGHQDGDGNYIRPSAIELLDHPFLQNSPTDDDEVEVVPPMREQAIREATVETYSTVLKGASKGNQPTPTTAISQIKPSDSLKDSPSPRAKLDAHSNSLEEDESDRFDEMPDSEVSIRKPKVMMGRGRELKEDDKPLNGNERQPSGALDTTDAPVQNATAPPTASAGLIGVGNPQVASETMGPVSTQNQASAQNQGSALHYLVAAAVIEHEQQTARPYEDDILKLVVTLPVEGQTQNVQFDFHLVEDDPVQVAKEMVAELGIPLAAVLEISETISGLARAARVKQDKYVARIQKPQGNARAQSQGIITQAQPEMKQGMMHQPQAQPEMKQGMMHQQQAQPEMKQGMMHQQQAQPEMKQGMMHQQQAQPEMQQGMMHQQQAQSEMQQGMMHQHQPMGQMNQNRGVMQSNQSMPVYMNSQQMVQPHTQQGQHVQQPVHQQGMGMQDQTVQMHPQQMSQHSSMGQMSMQSQHLNQQSGDSQARLQGNPQLQSQQVGQPGGQSEMSMQNPPTSHLGHNQHHQVPMNHHVGQNGPQTGQVSSDANLHSAQQPYGHSVPMQKQAPMMHMSNAGQPEVQSQTPSSTFGQTPMQHVQMPPQQAGQNGGQGPPDNQGQAPTNYGHQAQTHTHMQAPPMGQGMQMHGPAGQGSSNYQAPPPVEAQSQHSSTQYRRNSSHGQSHGLQQPMALSAQQNSNLHQPPQQVPNQQMQMVSQGGQNQGYGHAVASQLSSAQPQQQAVQQQQISGQQSQQQMPSHQQPQHQAAQSGHQMPSTVGAQPQQAVSAAGTSNLTAQVEVTKTAPQIPASGSEDHMVSGSSSLLQQAAGSGAPASQDNHMGGVLGVLSTESDDDFLDDELRAAELRKVDEDFKKNVMRAKKVFDARMDNLQRTQVQREALHLKTLEKHEKERVDFEKRMQQEEIEQNRRIEHLQKEWDKRREAMRLQQLAEAESQALEPLSQEQNIGMPVSNHSGSGGNSTER